MGVRGAAVQWRLTVAFLTPDWPLDTAANGIISYVDSVTAGLRRLGHTPCILSAHSDQANFPPDVYLLEQQERSAFARIRNKLTSRINPSEARRHMFARDLVRATR